MRTFLRSLARSFRARGLQGGPWTDLLRAMHRVRVLVGVSALGVAWLLPDATPRERILFAVLVGGFYLPYAVTVLAITRRRQGSVSRIGTVVADMLIVFTFQAALPETRFVGMIGYLLIVAIYSAIGGLPAGATITVGAIGLTLLAQVVDPFPPFVDLYTLCMFAAAALGLAFLLERAGREQRRAIHELDESVGKLEETRSQLEEAQRLAHVGSWRWDVAANITSWSCELYRIFGVDSAHHQATYEGFLQLVHPEDREMVNGTVRSSRETGDPFSLQHRIIRPDHAVRWLDSRGQVVRDRRGSTVAMVGTGQDITERKELERLRREFVSGISHDVRTPLTSIKGFASLIRSSWRDIGDDERSDYLARIERSAHELETLVVQLLEYSRLEAGHASVAPGRMRFEEWVRELLDELAPALAGHEVFVDVPPGLELNADASALRRVVGNLVENAAKFAPATTRIRVEASRSEEQTLVSVCDEGPGIPEGERERVFDAFYRGADAKTNARGTGLGLAVAKRYVELHGGRIWVEETQSGTTISFSLPLAGLERPGERAIFAA